MKRAGAGEAATAPTAGAAQQRGGGGVAGERADSGGGSSGGGSSSGSAAVPPAERGATAIADRVVAKIAAHAAREALSAGSEAPGVPRGRRSEPHATVTVRGPRARVYVSVTLGYPSDIGAQCAAVRRQVAVRVKELVGMEVRDVAVDVERLHSVHLDGRTLRRVT